MKYTPFVVFAVAVLAIQIVRRRRNGRSPRPSMPKGPSALRQYVETRFGDIGLVAAREIRERTRGRIFRVGTLLILCVVAAAILVPALNKSTTPSAEVGVVGTISPALRTAVESAARGVAVAVHVTRAVDLSTGENALRKGKLDVLIVGGVRIVLEQSIGPSDSSSNAQLAEGIASNLGTLETVAAAHLSRAQADRLAHPIRVSIGGLTPAASKSPVHGTTIIGLILVFVLLSQYSAWILIGVAEEKSSRVVEVLLATVRAIHLLSGKVLGIGTVALTQASLIVVFALVLTKAVGSNILQGTAPLDIVSSLLWLVLGYAFYCWVYAAAGSLAERQSQLQSLSFPLSLPMIVGYVLSITAAASGNASGFFKVLAYLPPTAPFAMPVLVGLGQVTSWEFILAIAISIVSTFGVARFAAGIYKRAILRTGRSIRLREVFRSER